MGESLRSNNQGLLLAKMESSLTAAFVCALNEFEYGDEQAKVLDELFSYASREGLESEVIDEIYDKALMGDAWNPYNKLK